MLITSAMVLAASSSELSSFESSSAESFKVPTRSWPLTVEQKTLRRLLREDRALELTGKLHQYEAVKKVRFHMKRGMSRASLEGIYGKAVVSLVFDGAEKKESSAVLPSTIENPPLPHRFRGL